MKVVCILSFGFVTIRLDISLSFFITFKSTFESITFLSSAFQWGIIMVRIHYIQQQFSALSVFIFSLLFCLSLKQLVKKGRSK